jgi:hypothetical protein
MSLIPINLSRYRDWTIQQLYYLLFPYIKEDFMGRKDCQIVHAEGNMQAVVSGETGIVTHAVRGGSDTVLAAKEAEYRVLSEEGGLTIEAAQETGQFTGVAR